MPQERHISGIPTVAPGIPPHAGQPLLWAGAPPKEARLFGILIHGRGADALDIIGLGEEFDVADVAWTAPEAAGRTWYPFSFLSPLATNEPGLSSALSVIEGLVHEADRLGFPADKIVLGGFSQGACLAAEYAARHPRNYAAILCFSGGVIGPPGAPRDHKGTFNGTPVFLGCSDRDPHIPAERVQETADVFKSKGAIVDMRLYPGMPHTIVRDELDAVRTLLGQ